MSKVVELTHSYSIVRPDGGLNRLPVLRTGKIGHTKEYHDGHSDETGSPNMGGLAARCQRHSPQQGENAKKTGTRPFSRGRESRGDCHDATQELDYDQKNGGKKVNHAIPVGRMA